MISSIVIVFKMQQDSLILQPNSVLIFIRKSMQENHVTSIKDWTHHQLN